MKLILILENIIYDIIYDHLLVIGYQIFSYAFGLFLIIRIK